MQVMKHIYKSLRLSDQEMKLSRVGIWDGAHIVELIFKNTVANHIGIEEAITTIQNVTKFFRLVFFSVSV